MSEIIPEPYPVISVIRGDPTPAEIAALVVVIAALSRIDAPARPPSAASDWAARWRGLRTQLRPGPDGWHRSTRS